MSAAAVFKIGHTKITLETSGCVGCGATNSIGWEQAERFQVTIGDRRQYIELKRCAVCAEQRGSQWPARRREQLSSSNLETGRTGQIGVAG